MKVREILLELAEVLNRHGQYGAWIDSHTKEIYPVQQHKHAGYIEQHFPESKRTDSYSYAFMEMHWVRVEYSRAGTLNIEGMDEDIQRIAPILIATIVQPDMDEVSVRKNHERYSPNERSFGLPEDRRDAIQFIRGH